MEALLGPRGFEYANIFQNPDPQALNRDLMISRASTISELSGVPKAELVAWVFTWMALSSLFSEMDGHKKAARRSYAIAGLARSVMAEIGDSCR